VGGGEDEQAKTHVRFKPESGGEDFGRSRGGGRDGGVDRESGRDRKGPRAKKREREREKGKGKFYTPEDGLKVAERRFRQVCLRVCVS